MCLVTPHAVMLVVGDVALVSRGGGCCEWVSLALLDQPPASGDFVAIRDGYAVGVLSELEAKEITSIVWA